MQAERQDESEDEYQLRMAAPLAGTHPSFAVAQSFLPVEEIALGFGSSRCSHPLQTFMLVLMLA